MHFNLSSSSHQTRLSSSWINDAHHSDAPLTRNQKWMMREEESGNIMTEHCVINEDTKKCSSSSSFSFVYNESRERVDSSLARLPRKKKPATSTCDEAHQCPSSRGIIKSNFPKHYKSKHQAKLQWQTCAPSRAYFCVNSENSIQARRLF